MDPTLITPFMESIQNVFSMMLQLPVTFGEPVVKTESASAYDVSGIIGMSGDVTGSVVLSFPKETAERVVAIFTGEELPVEHEDFADAIGELVNMVSGGAKGMFQKKHSAITVPSVVIGKHHTVSRPKGVPCISIPCETDCGVLSIEVCIADREKEEKLDESVSEAA